MVLRVDRTEPMHNQRREIRKHEIRKKNVEFETGVKRPKHLFQ